MTQTQSGWTRLTSLSTKYEADLLAGRLRKAGIRARITRSPSAPAAWLSAIGNPGGPIEVHVPAKEAKSSREILREVKAPRHAPYGSSRLGAIRSIGRGLIAFALISVVVLLLFQALR